MDWYTEKLGMSEKWESSPPRIYFKRTMFSSTFILCKITIYSFADVHMDFPSPLTQNNLMLLDYSLWCFNPSSDHCEFAVIAKI